MIGAAGFSREAVHGNFAIVLCFSLRHFILLFFFIDLRVSVDMRRTRLCVKVAGARAIVGCAWWEVALEVE